MRRYRCSQICKEVPQASRFDEDVIDSEHQRRPTRCRRLPFAATRLPMSTPSNIKEARYCRQYVQRSPVAAR